MGVCPDMSIFISVLKNITISDVKLGGFFLLFSAQQEDQVFFPSWLRFWMKNSLSLTYICSNTNWWRTFVMCLVSPFPTYRLTSSIVNFCYVFSRRSYVLLPFLKQQWKTQYQGLYYWLCIHAGLYTIHVLKCILKMKFTILSKPIKTLYLPE